jgi:aminoglycoside 3-N-acetyltransferase
MMFSRSQLCEGFRKLGVAPGDTVMVHASVRAVGAVAGGPDQIHLALKDALTTGGTMLMYPACPDHYDEVGRGFHDEETEREIREKLPVWDAWTARSARDNGTLVEFFRTSPGTIVNDHTARFAAWGKQAGHLFSSQPWSYAFGSGSALERFVELDGRILLIGSDHDQVTFLHYAEHIVDIPDKIVAKYKVPVLENGERVWRDQEEFDTSERAHANWPDRFFARLVDTYLAKTNNQGGRVGNANCVLFDARGLLEFSLPIMTALASDPHAADHLHP